MNDQNSTDKRDFLALIAAAGIAAPEPPKEPARRPIRCCRCKFVHAEQDRTPKRDRLGHVLTCPRCGAHNYFMVREDGKTARDESEWAATWPACLNPHTTATR